MTFSRGNLVIISCVLLTFVSISEGCEAKHETTVKEDKKSKSNSGSWRSSARGSQGGLKQNIFVFRGGVPGTYTSRYSGGLGGSYGIPSMSGGYGAGYYGRIPSMSGGYGAGYYGRIPTTVGVQPYDSYSLTEAFGASTLGQQINTALQSISPYSSYSVSGVPNIKYPPSQSGVTGHGGTTLMTGRPGIDHHPGGTTVIKHETSPSLNIQGIPGIDFTVAETDVTSFESSPGYTTVSKFGYPGVSSPPYTIPSTKGTPGFNLPFGVTKYQSFPSYSSPFTNGKLPEGVVNAQGGSTSTKTIEKPGMTYYSYYSSKGGGTGPASLVDSKTSGLPSLDDDSGSVSE